MKIKYTIEEKIDFVLRTLFNVEEIDIENKLVRLKCPVCENVFEDTFYNTFWRIKERKLPEEDNNYHYLTCENRKCSNIYSQLSKYVKEKKENTFLKKYGVKTNLLLKENKIKSIEAIIKKYNSFENMSKINWEKYYEKTGFKHNMLNPESVLKNQERRVKTLKSFSEERKKTWFEKRIATMEKNGLKLFGGKRPIVSAISKQQIDFFEEISKYTDFHIYYGEQEQIVYSIDGCKYFFLDGYIKEKNIAIEYNGDYWHANPVIYKKDEYLRHFNNSKILVEEIWKKDEERKKNIIEKINCIFFIVWEYDWLNNKENVIKEFKELLGE